MVRFREVRNASPAACNKARLESRLTIARARRTSDGNKPTGRSWPDSNCRSIHCLCSPLPVPRPSPPPATSLRLCCEKGHSFDFVINATRHNRNAGTLSPLDCTLGAVADACFPGRSRLQLALELMTDPSPATVPHYVAHQDRQGAVSVVCNTVCSPRLRLLNEPPKRPTSPPCFKPALSQFFLSVRMAWLLLRPCGLLQENIITGVDRWWANGNIICNEHQRPREAKSQVRELPFFLTRIRVRD